MIVTTPYGNDWPWPLPPAHEEQLSKDGEMDIQLLVRLSRMTSPRILTLSADIVAAKRLAETGMIEVTGQARSEKRLPASCAVHVRQIRPAGLSAIAAEKERLCGPSEPGPWRRGARPGRAGSSAT